MSEPKTKSAKKNAIIWIVFGVVLVILLGGIALPNFIKAWNTSTQNACISNLRQMDAAANQYALESHKTNGEAIHFPDDLKPYIKLNAAGEILPCPSGGSYSIARVGDTPKCSLGTNGDSSHRLP